jgi:NOL1/NOP2/fmu family ribosome biogenesis protein
MSDHDPDSDPERTNDGQRFDRLPETPADREVAGRASREEVLDWWETRFGIGREVLGGYSFWEKGAGKVWVFNGEAADPSPVEAIGTTFLRTRQEHWKPTTRAVQRFGGHATRNVLEVGPERASRFVAGEDQDLPQWDGDWGYLIVSHRIAGASAPIGVGLYLHGELRSVVPKGSRADLPVVEE